MFFNTKGLGGLSHPVRVHRTSFLHKALWAIGISFFAAIACLASGSLIMSTFIVAFAAISWHFIVRDEKVTRFAILENSSVSRIHSGEFTFDADEPDFDSHAMSREPVEVGMDWGHKYDPTYYVNG